MKKRYLFPIVFASLAVIFALGAFFWWRNATSPVSSDTTRSEFLILKGTSAEQIAEKLHEEGFIRDPLAFKFYVQLTGSSKNIQAGEFLLSPSYSLSEVVDVLTSGPVEVWVTTPEGLRKEEVVQRFIEGLELQGGMAQDFRNNFLTYSQGKEGYLFPDTYLFPREATAQIIIDRMLTVFNQRLEEVDMENSALSLEEVVILASLIEREAITNAERPEVAGVLKNRLDTGMALQVDATLQYVVGSQRCSVENAQCEWWQPPTAAQKEIESPFNTYQNPGLPPAPIANPGLESLKAAASPMETDYFYYLHDSNGNIHFAETFEEHNENIRNYLD